MGPPAPEPLIHRAVRVAWDAVRDALFPRRCAACRAFLPELLPGEDRAELPAHVCPACRAGVLPAASPRCSCCGTPFRGRTGGDHLCGRCIETPPAFARARAALVYERTAIDLVHALKYKGRLELARPLGRLLRQTYEDGWRGEPVELVVPVPLHPARLRERGFNQAEVLVRRWGDGGPPVAADTLRRTRATAPQFGLGRAEREDNLRGAIEVCRQASVAGRRVLLVDDVLTTGATVNECARRLKAGGAAQVEVLTLARVL